MRFCGFTRLIGIGFQFRTALSVDCARVAGMNRDLTPEVHTRDNQVTIGSHKAPPEIFRPAPYA